MEKTFNTHKEFIEFVCSCFTYENRAKEGEESKPHYASKLDTPQWLIDIIIKAHDNEMTNNFRYEVLYDTINYINDNYEEIYNEDGNLIVDQDDFVYETLEEVVCEVDIYNSDLLNWLADNLYRIDDVDNALRSTGGDSIIRAIQYAQTSAKSLTARILWEGINKEWSEMEDIEIEK